MFANGVHTVTIYDPAGDRILQPPNSAASLVSQINSTHSCHSFRENLSLWSPFTAAPYPPRIVGEHFHPLDFVFGRSEVLLGSLCVRHGA